MNDNSILKRNPAAIFAEVGDEIIFLHESEGVYYSVEGVGSLFWQSLASPQKFADLVSAIMEEYDVSKDVLISDLTEMINEMVKHDLVFHEDD